MEMEKFDAMSTINVVETSMTKLIKRNCIFEEFLHYLAILYLHRVNFVKSSPIARITRRLQTQRSADTPRPLQKSTPRAVGDRTTTEPFTT